MQNPAYSFPDLQSTSHHIIYTQLQATRLQSTMADDDIDAQLAGLGKELDKDAEIDRKLRSMLIS